MVLFFLQNNNTKLRRCSSVILAKSGVDMLSASGLALPCQPQLPLSTAGVVHVWSGWFVSANCRTIICGNDADDTGERAAGHLTADTRFVRLQPPVVKDWNELLIKQSKSA